MSSTGVGSQPTSETMRPDRSVIIIKEDTQTDRRKENRERIDEDNTGRGLNKVRQLF